MLQPTGSVYLDASPTSSTKGRQPSSLGARTTAAGILGVVGIIALTLTTLLGGIRILLRDPATVTDAVEAALDDEEVQARIQLELADAIENQLLDPEVTNIAEVLGIDVKSEAVRISPLVLTDPVFRRELTALVAQVHRQVLIEPSSEPLDFEPVTEAVLAVIRRESSELSRILPLTDPTITLDTDHLPDLTVPMSGLDQAVILSLLVSLACPLSALIHPRRHRVAAWIGRWMLTMGLALAVAAVGLPYLAGYLTGYSSAEFAVRELTVQLLAPAAFAGIVGMGMVSAAALLDSRERRRVADEGAAAALGVNEPLLIARRPIPQLSLPQRGLVDADHPLTSS